MSTTAIPTAGPLDKQVSEAKAEHKKVLEAQKVVNELLIELNSTENNLKSATPSADIKQLLFWVRLSKDKLSILEKEITAELKTAESAVDEIEKLNAGAVNDPLQAEPHLEAVKKAAQIANAKKDEARTLNAEAKKVVGDFDKGPGEEASQFMRKHPYIAWGALIVSVLIIIGVAWSFFAWGYSHSVAGIAESQFNELRKKNEELANANQDLSNRIATMAPKGELTIATNKVSEARTAQLLAEQQRDEAWAGYKDMVPYDAYKKLEDRLAQAGGSTSQPLEASGTSPVQADRNNPPAPGLQASDIPPRQASAGSTGATKSTLNRPRPGGNMTEEERMTRQVQSNDIVKDVLHRNTRNGVTQISDEVAALIIGPAALRMREQGVIRFGDDVASVIQDGVPLTRLVQVGKQRLPESQWKYVQRGDGLDDPGVNVEQFKRWFAQKQAQYGGGRTSVRR